jgi:hypothetical protein
MMSFLERRLWLSLLVVAGLAVLLLAAALRLGGGVPPLSPLRERPRTMRRALPEAPVAQWFSVPLLTRPVVGSNIADIVYTLHFQPPPPPPPPPTKKVELLFQGWYLASTGERRAYVKLGDALLTLTNGAKVVADHAIKDIGMRALTLTNAAGQTNVLEFNVKKGIDVPAS